MRVCSVCHRCYENAVTDCIEDGHPVLYETRVHDLESINGYQIERLLDLGTNAETYLACHIASGRSCLIRIHNAKGEHRDRFLRDAKTLASLFLPGVADVYEYGELGSGEVFVVAEHVEGLTLRDLLVSGGPPDLLTTIVLVRQAAEALHNIHQKGLLHRSVRPENIIASIDAAGNRSARIENLDLGGLVEHSIISDKFMIDSAIDSLRYFAPEQCSGEPAGPQTDVYSLGILLYEMLAGRPPFDDVKAAGLIEKHRNSRPPDIRIDDFELRMLLTHTLTESLNKRPQNRQSSANAFARQLRHMEQLATHVSTPPPAMAVPETSTRSIAASAPNFVSAVPGHSDPAVADRPMEIMPAPTPINNEAARPVTVVGFSNDAEMLNRFEPEPVTAPPTAVTQPVEEAASQFANVSRTSEREDQPHIFQRLSQLKLRRRKLNVELAISELSGPAGPSNTEIVSTTVTAAPRKIEWEQPDDDIPTIEDVRAAASESQVQEAKSIVEQSPYAEAIPDKQPIIVALEPSVETQAKAVAPAPAIVKMAASSRVPKRSAIQISNETKPKRSERGSTSKPPKPAHALPTDADEITAVTARSEPITINLDRPSDRRSPAPIRQVVPQPSNDIPFSLTLLGQQMQAAAEPGPSLFAAYSGSSHAAPIRTVIIGGGLVAAIAVFLFSGGDWNRLATLASVEPMPAKTATSDATIPEKQQATAPQPVNKPARYLEDQRPNNLEVSIENSKPERVNDRSSTASSKSKPIASDDTRVNSRARQKVVVHPTAVVENKSAEKKQGKTQKQLDGSTRPRIVKVPAS